MQSCFLLAIFGSDTSHWEHNFCALHEMFAVEMSVSNSSQINVEGAKDDDIDVCFAIHYENQK